MNQGTHCVLARVLPTFCDTQNLLVSLFLRGIQTRLYQGSQWVKEYIWALIKFTYWIQLHVSVSIPLLFDSLLTPKNLSNIFKGRKASRSAIDLLLLHHLCHCHHSLNLPINSSANYHSFVLSLSSQFSCSSNICCLFHQYLLNKEGFRTCRQTLRSWDQSSLSTRPGLFWQLPQEIGSIKDMFTFKFTSTFTEVAQI